MELWIVPVIMGGVFVLFLIITFIVLAALRRFGGSKKDQEKKIYIAQNGVETTATVTFVDKNFRLLVNQTPIYSIVEYKYQDNMGREHVRRIDNINSELVVRNKIEVNNTIKIRYLQEDPSQSVIMFDTN